MSGEECQESFVTDSETSYVIWVRDGGPKRRQDAELEVPELKVLRFALDRIRNEYTKGSTQVGQFGDKTKFGER